MLMILHRNTTGKLTLGDNQLMADGVIMGSLRENEGNFHLKTVHYISWHQSRYSNKYLAFILPNFAYIEIPC